MKRTCILILSLVILASCGTTVLVSENPRTEIFVNDKYEGTGKAYITRTGIPRKSKINGYTRGKQSAELYISRHFDGVTFLAGIFTYGPGFFFAWRYPKEVFIPVMKEYEDGPRENIWMKPPGSHRNP